jgi:ribonuclease BN (tRNA processing enzyme)
MEVNFRQCGPQPGRVWFALKVMLVLWLSLVQTNQAAECPPGRGLALQVLGSGGPVADDGRASSAYLVWQDGKARVLVDAGGGSFLRFGQANARFADLDLIAISHFHTDHSADLPALLKSGYFSRRTRSLLISGPKAGGPFPGLEAFIDSLLDSRRGAYAYLAGYLDGSDGLVKLRRVSVDHHQETAVAVMDEDGLRVTALGVPHGIVPALAYRVEAGGQSIVFASDQNGSSEQFPGFAQGATVLVAHLAIPENATGTARKLHAPASVIGQIAEKSSTGTLLLSHFMSRSLKDLDNSLVKIRLQFAGEIIIVEDLQCFELEKGLR